MMDRDGDALCISSQWPETGCAAVYMTLVKRAPVTHRARAKGGIEDVLVCI